jgi:hypothetical protein
VNSPGVPEMRTSVKSDPSAEEILTRSDLGAVYHDANH